jgi:hypothetical protein
VRAWKEEVLMTAKTVRNPYKIPQGYVFNPFDVLYNSPDPEEVGLQPFAEELRDYALLMDENIPGDFNLENMIYEIQENKLSFVRNGLIGFKIKSFKLYEKIHKSFQDFCEKALGMSHWYMNRLMEAARVVLKLALNGFTVLPTCEAQTRPLVKLHDDDLCDKWQEVIDTVPAHKITTERIKEVLGEPSLFAFIRVPKDLKARLEVKAGTHNMNIQKYLDAVCEDQIKPFTEEVDEEQIKHWQEDLENLTQEYEESQQAHKEEKGEHCSQQENSETVPIVTDDENIEEKEEEVEIHQEADSESIHLDNQLDEKAEVPEENLESLTLEDENIQKGDKESEEEYFTKQENSETVPIGKDSDGEEKVKIEVKSSEVKDFEPNPVASEAEVKTNDSPKAEVKKQKKSKKKKRSFLDLFPEKSSPSSKEVYQEKGKDKEQHQSDETVPIGKDSDGKEEMKIEVNPPESQGSESNPVKREVEVKATDSQLSQPKKSEFDKSKNQDSGNSEKSPPDILNKQCETFSDSSADKPHSQSQPENSDHSDSKIDENSCSEDFKDDS